MRTLVALLLLALSSSSCFMSRSVTNVPLPRERFDQLQPGTTTAREAVQLLGAPTEVIQLGSRSAYRYDFTNLKRSGFTVILFSCLNEDQRADRAWLFFDAKDVLTHVGSTFEGNQAQYALPWQDIHGTTAEGKAADGK